jgi:hypothetical protein
VRIVDLWMTVFVWHDVVVCAVSCVITPPRGCFLLQYLQYDGYSVLFSTRVPV